MQNQDSDAAARNPRVQELRREVGQLVALSREQRRTIDGLLTRLETVLQRARRHRLSQRGWRAAGSSRG